MNEISQKAQSCIQFTGIGSLLGLHTTKQPVFSSSDLVGEDDRMMELIFLDLLERGYYMARRGFIALMIPLGDAEADGFKLAFSEILQTRGELLRKKC